MTQSLVPNIAIVGATGAVGQELLRLLDDRKFSYSGLKLFASPRSAGKKIEHRGKAWTCEVMVPGCFAGVDIAFFDASDEVSKKWVEEASRAGAWVVDNSATYRMDAEVPLVVPEVNGDAVRAQMTKAQNGGSWKSRVFAGPNCSTVQLVMALRSLKEWGLSRVVVSTYQSTSGAGAQAMEELQTQCGDFLTKGREKVTPEIFAHPIAFNCIPLIGKVTDESGFSSEEKKLMEETKRILDLPSLRVCATAVRVPTLRSHAESVQVEFERAFDLKDVRARWAEMPGLVVEDAPQDHVYPLAWSQKPQKVQGAAGRDEVFVGRIRRDPSVTNGLTFWVVSDNLRKGAATNAIQIGEQILKLLG